MTKYTFSLNNNPSTFYAPKYNTTDYSKTLDNLIAADIAEKNPWLYTTKNSNPEKIKIKINTKSSFDDLETAFIHGKKYTYSFSDACNFLSKLYLKCPFKKNTTYKLSSGDYIEITDDYIHINDQMFYFNLMDNGFFCNLSDNLKKTIATIYIDGLKITIKK